MSIDIEKLRALLSGADNQPWHYSGGDHAAFVNDDDRNLVADCGDGRGLDNAALICAAVNTLPELLAIAEAAKKWQAVHERPTSDKRGVSRALWDAVDAARKAAR